MNQVTSRDGTTIAFERIGGGPALVLVSPATGLGSHYSEQAELLAPHFAVYTYDRRGRGASSDTAPYVVEREIEDLGALIDAAGGSAFVYGMSSGAILALRAANSMPNKVRKLVLYEPPIIINDARPPLPADYVAHLNELVAAGQRSEAVEYYLTVAIGIPAEYIESFRSEPIWQHMEQVAHTLAYDGAVVGNLMSGKPIGAGQWPNVTMPTAVLAGGNSEIFFHEGGQALADVLPNAEFWAIEGQDHGIAPSAIAPVLQEYFAS